MPIPPIFDVPVWHAGGCFQPVLLRGRVDHIDGATGELLHRYTTVHGPGGVLPVACKTRRASRCPPCAEVYRADTYQLIRAGLTGGKVLRGAEDADEGGAHDADGESDDSGSVVSKVSATSARCRAGRRRSADRGGPERDYGR